MPNQIVESEAAGESSPAWYAIYTKHHHEKVACDSLHKKGLEVFLPLYRVASHWKDRKKTISFPLFPCYFFARTSLLNKTEILKTPGVFWLVEAGGRACQIPDIEIEMIRTIMAASANAAPHPFLKCGDFVRVRSGALSGLEGILVQVKNLHRVVISIEALKKAVAVEVEISTIERVRSIKEGDFPVTSEDRRDGRKSVPGALRNSGQETNRARIG